MHSHQDPKPIGKCGGCPLNLKKSCGMFEHPAEQWAHGRCKGFMNAKMFEAFVAAQAREHEKTHKEIRREKQEERKSISHVDGIPNPGGSRW
ncbi:MAG TPA: hypothetical protein PKM67_05470 [Kiritimatiellia bacterium]|nr:hypothetical protein [Kiritimatiellia bacterium]HNS80888.1 hypothetical protein [Kiritimatiellia bacterium]HPA77305.1 hypothetical protein [Kiritimatiellia bacterium]HQQ04088.1 hypothetical protein [Kiritimatiellia bacterium]